MNKEPVIETRDLYLVINGKKILEQISLKIYPAEIVGIIGPNGAGKTTLLRIFLGLMKPTFGSVKIFGRNSHELGEKIEEVGYMPQRPAAAFNFPFSVFDVAAMGEVTRGKLGRPFTKAQEDKVRDSLDKVGVLHLENEPFAQLSGGEQQRVFLARAICKKPSVLLLDEPNSNLDFPTQNRFFDLLMKLKQEHGLTVVMVSHDLAMVASYADELICINGNMHVHGSPSVVLNSPDLEKAYRCEFDLLYARKRG